jgi:hypothetical protein
MHGLVPADLFALLADTTRRPSPSASMSALSVSGFVWAVCLNSRLGLRTDNGT